MNAIYALIAVVVLYLIVYLGVGKAGQEFVFGIIIPYTAIVVFLLGFVWRIVNWARSAVPFRITTTCGQQKSLGFVKNNNLENPHNLRGVVGRMALEILSSGRIQAKKFISHNFGLDQILDAFNAVESRQGMKVVVNP